MIPPEIQQAFKIQSNACTNLGSPFMGQLMQLCGTMAWPGGSVTDRIFAWQGDISPGGQSIALRLAGALHALYLQGHTTLSAVYPPQAVNDEALWSAVAETLVSDADQIHSWLDSPPQTNEVRRSGALIALGHLLADRFGLPIRTSELGASGGLNLHWDAYALKLGDGLYGADAPALTLSPDWSGPKPPLCRPNVVARAGVDINPLNPADPDHALRLQAYLWADQPERLALTRAAMRVAKTSVSKGDAIDWLTGQLQHQPDQLHLIYSTVAWQYFPDDKKAQGARIIEEAGATATKTSPLAWFGMENDGGARGAALTLRLWPGDHTIALGRADFHGRWIEWNGV